MRVFLRLISVRDEKESGGLDLSVIITDSLHLLKQQKLEVGVLPVHPHSFEGPVLL